MYHSYTLICNFLVIMHMRLYIALKTQPIIPNLNEFNHFLYDYYLKIVVLNIIYSMFTLSFYKNIKTFKRLKV